MPTVENGFHSDLTNLKTYADDTAEGFFEVQCNSGYQLDETIGGRVMCLESGDWSQPLPECTCKFSRPPLPSLNVFLPRRFEAMGSCCISDLFDFIRNTDGIQVDRQNSYLYTNGVNDKRAIGGSNITILCQDNYEMIGGSPTVLCTEENLWTPFPQCVPLPTLTEPDPSSLRCPVDAETWSLPNGYLSQSRNVVVYSDNTASGKRRTL